MNFSLPPPMLALSRSLVAVSVLYNDPDFQLELSTSHQVQYHAQFSGSESESSDREVAGGKSSRWKITLRVHRSLHLAGTALR